jgi:archaellum component FlaF (FlaF/FlaG flagellin family)
MSQHNNKINNSNPSPTTGVTFLKNTVIAIALMMVAVSTSETSVNFYQTFRRNITEDKSSSFSSPREPERALDMKYKKVSHKVSTVAVW